CARDHGSSSYYAMDYW
nr:immunoglobulin heavy chain junction region [Mus musculus]